MRKYKKTYGLQLTIILISILISMFFMIIIIFSFTKNMTIENIGLSALTIALFIVIVIVVSIIANIIIKLFTKPQISISLECLYHVDKKYNNRVKLENITSLQLDFGEMNSKGKVGDPWTLIISDQEKGCILKTHPLG